METESPAPAKGPRPWLLGLLLLAVVGFVAYRMWPESSTAVPTPPSNSRPRTPRASAQQTTIDPNDLKVKLEALNAQRPDPGAVERNPFRFTPPPAPPAPKLPPAVQLPPPGPPAPPPPPPIPPIPLKFMGTVERGPLKLAALTDCKGYTYAGREGEPIDGRYRLVRIGQESVVMEYLNGTGRTTIRKGGECPR
jgi:hypothetical protein